MNLYYEFNGEDYPYELSYKQISEAVADICSNNKSDYDVIRDFINKSDLEYECFMQYQEELADYFRCDAYEKYKNDCADDEYWKNTDIHGGI